VRGAPPNPVGKRRGYQYQEEAPLNPVGKRGGISISSLHFNVINIFLYVLTSQSRNLSFLIVSYGGFSFVRATEFGWDPAPATKVTTFVGHRSQHIWDISGSCNSSLVSNLPILSCGVPIDFAHGAFALFVSFPCSSECLHDLLRTFQDMLLLFMLWKAHDVFVRSYVVFSLVLFVSKLCSMIL